jgi:hypothetical protein
MLLRSAAAVGNLEGHWGSSEVASAGCANGATTRGARRTRLGGHRRGGGCFCSLEGWTASSSDSSGLRGDLDGGHTPLNGLGTGGLDCELLRLQQPRRGLGWWSHAAERVECVRGRPLSGQCPAVRAAIHHDARSRSFVQLPASSCSIPPSIWIKYDADRPTWCPCRRLFALR